MNVSGISSYQPSSYVKASTNVRTSAKRSENLFVNSLAAQNKTDEKYNSDQTSEIWGELAEEYDIRNATHDQLCGIAKKLLDAGQISSREFAVLTFDMDKLLQVLKADSLKGGPPVTASSLYLTPASSDGRRDWIAEYEARLKQNPSTYNYKLLQILQRLEK